MNRASLITATASPYPGPGPDNDTCVVAEVYEDGALVGEVTIILGAVSLDRLDRWKDCDACPSPGLQDWLDNTEGDDPRDAIVRAVAA